MLNKYEYMHHYCGQRMLPAIPINNACCLPAPPARLTLGPQDGHLGWMKKHAGPTKDAYLKSNFNEPRVWHLTVCLVFLFCFVFRKTPKYPDSSLGSLEQFCRARGCLLDCGPQ